LSFANNENYIFSWLFRPLKSYLLIFIRGNLFKSARECCQWFPADFEDTRRTFLKVDGLVIMAAGSPAFCCKSSLRSGLYAAIRLRNRAGYHQAQKKTKFICGNLFKSAGEYCQWFPC
jgi:hypothetical protein